MKMKRQFALCATIMAIVFTTVARADLLDGLVGYWPFDGDAKDYSGNGNHGISHGISFASDRHGNSSGAGSFGGYVSISTEGQLNDISDFSLCVWINATSWDNQYWLPIMCKGSTRQFGLEIEDAGCKTFIDHIENQNLSIDHNYSSCFELGYMGNAFISTDQRLSLGVWTHVAVTREGGHMCAYVNGTLIGSSDGDIPTRSNGDLEIGRDSPGGMEYFHGRMDEVFLFNRALSALEIKALYDGGLKVCTISFAANGGAGSMGELKVLSGAHVSLSANAFTREGYIFQGWATSAGGDVNYADGAEISIDSDMTLYAVWDNLALTLEAESADWSHGSITLRCADADTSGAAHSYSLFYEDENRARVAVSGSGAANVSVGADGFAHLTDSGFLSRLSGIPSVKYFVKDENGRWSAECVTRTRYLLSVGFDSYGLWWQESASQFLYEATEFKRLCERSGGFSSDNTTLLRNAEASVSGIRSALTSFATRTQPGDIFVFYIATHGADYSVEKQASLCAYKYNTYYSVAALQSDIRKFNSGIAIVCIIMACHSESMLGGEDFSEKINRWLVSSGFGQCLGNVAWIASCAPWQNSYFYTSANYTMFGQAFIADGFGSGYADRNLYGVDFNGNAYGGGNSDGFVTLGELGRYAGAFTKGVSDDKPSTVKLENEGLLDRIVLGELTSTPLLSKPGTPSRPSATQGDTRIDIEWTASANAASYRIYRYPLDSPGQWKWIGTSYGNTVKDETAMLTKEYGYRIKAVNPVGVSDLSDVAVGSRGTSKILDFLGSFFGTTTASADDYDAMEKSIAPNGFTYGASYVAGLDPTDPTSKFETTFSIGADGKPVVSWTPDLNEGGTKSERVYRVLGAKELGAAAQWDDVTDVEDPDAEGYRFFKAAVEMP